jgi:hypothetical protein
MKQRYAILAWVLMPCAALLLGAARSSAEPAWSADPKAKGREITAESIRRDTGFGDTSARMTMTLTGEGQGVSQRELRVSALENSNQDAGDKSLIFFETPKDVQGTVLLTHTRIQEPDDQWIYLPSIARVKRISAANKSGPFLGSEFAYEDLASQELEKYDYQWLKNEPCPQPLQARNCFVVERTPLDRNSGYKRQIVWIDDYDFQLRKSEFYNLENRLLKSLTLGDYRQYSGHFWRPHVYVMKNHQTKRMTELKVHEIKFKSGLTETDFTEQAMERLR